MTDSLFPEPEPELELFPEPEPDLSPGQEWLRDQAAERAEAALDRPPTLETARQARDAGMALVDGATDEDWKAEAADAIERLAASGRPFMSDDVWPAIGRDADPPANMRALGPIMMRAARAGRIVKTGDYRPSVRSRLAPKPLWIGSEHRP
ncbi:MAG: hypothetical protein ACF8PN_05045 [Phycisphaerales bacterium]